MKTRATSIIRIMALVIATSVSRMSPLVASGLYFAAQPVALTAASEVPPFTARTVYNGLIFSGASTVPMESGYFKLDVSRSGHFTGNLLVAQHRAGFSGKFNTGGTAYVQVKVGTGEYADALFGSYEIQKVEWALVLQMTNGLEEISGEIVSYEHGGWRGIVQGVRAGFDARTNPAPQAGRYTLLFPADLGNQSGPGGDGYASLTVDKAGNVRVMGVLADNSQVTASSVLNEAGVWPFFMPSDGGRGVLVGWLQFTNSTDSAMVGELVWARLRHPGVRFYSLGFTNQTSVVASRYVPPSSNKPVLDLTRAVLVLGGGELASSVTNSLTPRGPTEFRGTADSRLVGRFSPLTGLFLGTAPVPGTTQTIRFSGAVLQNQNVGLGYFAHGSSTGEVIIEAAVLGEL
jgi:hypothetical protein